MTKKLSIAIAISLILAVGAVMMLKNLPNTVNIPNLGIKTVGAESIPAKTTKQRTVKPKQTGIVLNEWRTSAKINGFLITLRSAQRGIDIVKPNNMIARRDNLTSGCIVQFSTSDESYFVHIGTVGKNSIQILKIVKS